MQITINITDAQLARMRDLGLSPRQNPLKQYDDGALYVAEHEEFTDYFYTIQIDGTVSRDSRDYDLGWITENLIDDGNNHYEWEEVE